MGPSGETLRRLRLLTTLSAFSARLPIGQETQKLSWCLAAFVQQLARGRKGFVDLVNHSWTDQGSWRLAQR
jgi:hypothetical protein